MLKHILAYFALALSLIATPALAVVNKNADAPQTTPVPKADYDAFYNKHQNFLYYIQKLPKERTKDIVVTDITIGLTVAFKDAKWAYEGKNMTNFTSATETWVSYKVSICAKIVDGCLDPIPQRPEGL